MAFCSNSGFGRLVDTDVIYTGPSITCGGSTVNPGDTVREFISVVFLCANDIVVNVEGNSLPIPDGTGSKVAFVAPGTYTQTGGSDIVVPSGSMGILSWDGDEWSLSQSVEMPALPNEIVDLTVVNGEDVVYSDYVEARNAVPLELRKGGMILSYLTPQGKIYEKLELATWTSGNEQWRRIDVYSDTRFTEPFDGYVFDGEGGVVVRSTQYFCRSKFIQLNDMTVYNFTVLSDFEDENGYKKAFIFDKAFNYLGAIYSDEPSPLVYSDDISKSEIELEYPTAAYIAFNCRLLSGFFIDSSSVIRVRSDRYKNSTVRGDDFSVNGYVHKDNGYTIPSTAYRSTRYIRYAGGNVTITGFSGGETNNVALLALYDDKTNFIGFRNASQGITNDYVVAESEISEGTYYIRATRYIDQTNAYLHSTDCFVVPSISTDGGGDTPDVADNIFTLSDPKLRISFNNYLGNTENIHPKVLYFKDKWNGFKFWMAYTPYPGGNTLYENPAIAVSNDGINWELPDGAPDPLDDKPSYGYNSDTHLVYRDDLDILEVYYRPVNVALSRNEIKVVKFDGSSWSSPELVLGVDDEQMLSPAILWEDGIYKWYYCKPGSYNVFYAESTSSDPGDLFNNGVIDFDFQTLGIRPWHIDVIRTEKGVEMVIQGFRPSVGEGAASSNLYYLCEFDDGSFSDLHSIIEKGELDTDIDFGGIYRASILKVGFMYFVYYSTLDNIPRRGIALKFGRDIKNLRAV